MINLFRKFEPKRYTYIHIGKTGGSYISEQCENIKNFKVIHMAKPKYESSRKYIIWIRDPVARFISAFNHSLNLVNFDIEDRDFNTLYNDPDTPYYKLKNKIVNKIAYNHPFREWKSGIEYEELITYFKTPNNLAEALSSDDIIKKRKAMNLMGNSEVEHLHKGIGWYLDNGNFIEKYHKDVIFVGKQETMVQDLRLLSKSLNFQFNYEMKETRKNNFENDKFLSPLGLSNIKSYYQKSDYKALLIMNQYKLINDEVLNNYGVGR